MRKKVAISCNIGTSNEHARNHNVPNETFPIKSTNDIVLTNYNCQFPFCQINQFQKVTTSVIIVVYLLITRQQVAVADLGGAGTCPL